MKRKGADEEKRRDEDEEEEMWCDEYDPFSVISSFSFFYLIFEFLGFIFFLFIFQVLGFIFSFLYNFICFLYYFKIRLCIFLGLNFVCNLGISFVILIDFFFNSSIMFVNWKSFLILLLPYFFHLFPYFSNQWV